ncbi:hypothetical protein ACWF94_03410 [Streptomyces sp. NPDC055078]
MRGNARAPSRSPSSGTAAPGRLRERVADCDVLLVIVHEGWAEERPEPA